MSDLNDLRKRIEYLGGNKDGRNVKNKLWSMKAAKWDSYQGEWITLKDDKKWRCLINPEKQTTDYDQKQISIEHEAGLQPGDVFFWDRTNKHWIVYNEFEEEEAYFRARIRKCDYQVDVDGTPYWVWLRGPVETAIVTRQKHQIITNDMNYSLLIWITNDEKTNDWISRFKIIHFDNHRWRVAAVDRYSQQGIIEISLEEWFDNELEDAEVAPEVIEPEEMQPYIDGPQLVHVYDTNLSFSLANTDSTGSFVVSSNKAKIVEATNHSCVIDILTGRAGTFELKYTSVDGDEVITLPITIQSF